MRTLHQANRSPILSEDGIERAYVVNLKPSAQDSLKLKVWAVHFFKLNAKIKKINNTERLLKTTV